MELDIIGYHPTKNILVHYEPSLDAQSWTQREQRYKKKFSAGRKYIKEEVFKWVNEDCVLEQFAIFISHPKNRHELAGGKVLSVDKLTQQIKKEIVKEGVMSKKAIPEIYPLLRTIQMTLNGYYKNLRD